MLDARLLAVVVGALLAAPSVAAEIGGGVIVHSSEGPDTAGLIVHVEDSVGFVLVSAPGIGRSKVPREFGITLQDGRTFTARQFPAIDEDRGLAFLEFGPASLDAKTLAGLEVRPLVAVPAEVELRNGNVPLRLASGAGQSASTLTIKCGDCPLDQFLVAAPDVMPGSAVTDSAGRVAGIVTETLDGQARVTSSAGIRDALLKGWNVPLNKLLVTRAYRSTPSILTASEVEDLIKSNGFNNPSGRVSGPDDQMPFPDLSLLNDPAMFARFDEAFFLKLRDAARTQDVLGKSMPYRGALWHQYSIEEREGARAVRDGASSLVWLPFEEAVEENCRDIDWEGDGTLLATLLCIDALNDKKLLGADTWRLPTMEELASLAEERAIGLGEAGEPYFMDSRLMPGGGFYWSIDMVEVAGDRLLFWVEGFKSDSNDLPFTLSGPTVFDPLAKKGRFMAVRSAGLEGSSP
ncbi:DUF1566 domain-containing protein [Mesorhizobium sp. M0659]|uniref:hypothetical protein n=1 Tax=Mesorhizobium sp. M0659 TaxID=2956980 RepID=UPI003336CFEF